MRSRRGLSCLNLPLRPKMSNQCIKTDFASCVSLGPKGKMFLKKCNFLQSAGGLQTNLQEDMNYITSFLCLCLSPAEVYMYM